MALGSLLSPLVAGAEYLTVLGCGMLVQGTRGFGMEAQPELYVAGGLAVAAIVMMDAAKAKKDGAAPARRKRR